MKTYEIVIVGDTNDADYITQIAEITEEELQKIIPVVEAIKAFNKETIELNNYNRHNWPTSEYCRNETVEGNYPNLTKEQIDFFNDLYAPHGEHGIHTIESVVYYKIPQKIELL